MRSLNRWAAQGILGVQCPPLCHPLHLPSLGFHGRLMGGGIQWAALLAVQWQWIFRYYLFIQIWRIHQNFTVTSELGKPNLHFDSRPRLLCAHCSHWESGVLSRCQFEGAMALEWKNTIYEKYSPDIELCPNQHTTQYQACSWHLVAIYKVMERMHWE